MILRILKGQEISKGNCGVLNSSKKTRKKYFRRVTVLDGLCSWKVIFWELGWFIKKFQHFSQTYMGVRGQKSPILRRRSLWTAPRCSAFLKIKKIKFYISNIYHNFWVRYANSNCSENKEHLKLTSVDKGAELSVIFFSAGYNYPRKFLKKIDIN